MMTSSATWLRMVRVVDDVRMFDGRNFVYIIVGGATARSELFTAGDVQ